MLKNLFRFFVNLFILLFALFFVFRDGESILRALRHLIPFEKNIQDQMLKESRDLIFASVAVALLIAAIQGFWVARPLPSRAFPRLFSWAS